MQQLGMEKMPHHGVAAAVLGGLSWVLCPHCLAGNCTHCRERAHLHLTVPQGRGVSAAQKQCCASPPSAIGPSSQPDSCNTCLCPLVANPAPGPPSRKLSSYFVNWLAGSLSLRHGLMLSIRALLSSELFPWAGEGRAWGRDMGRWHL